MIMNTGLQSVNLTAEANKAEANPVLCQFVALFLPSLSECNSVPSQHQF